MKKISRRDLVMLAGGAVAAMAAPPGYLFLEQLLRARELLDCPCPPEAACPETGDAPQWAMLIDQGECIGCNQCTWACKAVNDCPGDVWWNVVYSQGPHAGTANGTAFLARPCMMCEDPQCVEVCPVQATCKRAGDGLVIMDYERCTGCRYCMAACPYGARYFNWKTPDEQNPAVPEFGKPEIPRRTRGVVEKCTFCAHRLDAGLAKGLKPGVDPEATPACVVACPVPARFFGDLRTGGVSHPKFGERLASSFLPKSTRIKNDLGLNPRVYYIPPGGK